MEENCCSIQIQNLGKGRLNQTAERRRRILAATWGTVQVQVPRPNLMGCIQDT